MGYGTRLEKRFSKKEIYEIMRNDGLCKIKFSEGSPRLIAFGLRI